MGTPPTNQPPLRRRTAATVLVVACLLAYLTSFPGAFVYDDINQILNNPDLRPGASLTQILTTTPRPITSLTFALNLAPYPGASIDSPPPTFEFHLVNLFIHTTAALFLLGILRRAAPKSANPLFPLAGALLWALHPLQTQSVTYIVQRAESLMGLFALASVYLLFRAHTAPKGLLRNLAVVGVASCSALAMGSKAVAFVLPFAILLIDRTLITGSFVSALRARKRMYAFLTATLAVPFITGIAQGVLNTTANPSAAVGFAYEGVSPFAYFISQPSVLVHYLLLVFLPLGQCIDYAWPVADSLVGALPSLIFVSLLASAALAGVWKNTRWGLCLALFFLLLAPTSSFIPIKDLAYEHRMYLPLAPIIVLVLMGVQSWLAPRDPRETKHLVVSAIAIAAIALGASTAYRNTVYKSDESIWRDVIAKGGNAPRAYTNLAGIHNRAQDYESAIEFARRALEFNPDSTEARGLLAQSLMESGDAHAAAAQFATYLANRPQDAPVRFNYAQALLSSDRPAEAVEQLDLLLRENPADDDAVASLDSIAQGAYQAADAELALRTYTVLTVHRSNDVNNWYNLGLTHARTGDYSTAIDCFKRALDISPSHEQAAQALRISEQQIEALSE